MASTTTQTTTDNNELLPLETTQSQPTNHIASQSNDEDEFVKADPVSIKKQSMEYIEAQMWFSRIMIIIFTLNVLMFLISFPFTIYSTIHFDGKLATFEDRPYKDAPYFAGNDFYQEFGLWYGTMVVFHVLCGTLASILLFIPLFITIKGSNIHKLFGLITVIFITLLYTFGNINITILTATRGYHPCSYVIQDSHDKQTSFNFMNYLNLSYYGPYLAEITAFGMIHAIYGKNQIEHDIFTKICLAFLSLCSIFFNVTRCIILLSIIIAASTGSFDECDEFEYFKCIFTLITFISEAPSSILSIWNIQSVCFGNKRKLHGRNMAVMSGMMVWTLLANIFFKIWSFGTVIAYILIVIALYIYCVEWIQKLCRNIIQRIKGMTSKA